MRTILLILFLLNIGYTQIMKIEPFTVALYYFEEDGADEKGSHDLTPEGTPLFTETSKGTKALLGDGSSYYSVVFNVDLSNGGTLESIVKRDASTAFKYVMKHYKIDNKLYLWVNSANFYVDIGGESYNSGLSGFTDTDNYHHYAVTWEDTSSATDSVRIYFDGVKVSAFKMVTSSGEGISLTSNSTIGWGSSSTGTVLSLDELRLSNITKTDSEILAAYENFLNYTGEKLRGFKKYKKYGGY